MDWRPGDLLFFYGRCATSRMISLATWGPSHVGIVTRYSGGMGDVLVESTTLCDLPDLRTGEKFKGVQFHTPEERIASYDGRVDVMRLANGWWLDRDECDQLCKLLWHMHGRPYDLAGAPLSGTRVFKFTRWMPYPDLGSLFCSELCAAALMRLGRLGLSNPSAYNPASLQRQLQRIGTYNRPEAVR